MNGINRNNNEAAITCELLNKLLASIQVGRQNLHSMHWNIKGRNFFELHEELGDWYNEALTNADDVAERILQLGGVPLSTFTEYIRNSKLLEVGVVSDETEIIQNVIDDSKLLLNMERKILKRASDVMDEGTFRIMSDLIGANEKRLWKLHAFLGKSI